MSSRGSSVGLFAGIGGIELGLEAAGFSTELLCEIEPAAKAVLRNRFDGVSLRSDVTKLRSLPSGCDVLSAGFPCQDLSQAGRLAGIGGARSGLVDHVLEFLGKKRRNRPTWLLLENVPFMLQLDKGEAMRFLTSELNSLGYRWAYRVVDARSFGVPQRRRRVVLLASSDEDPRPVLLADDEGAEPSLDREGKACGFYWTEGNTGLGWAVDAVPTIKGGSGLGIPSPPAIWMTDGSIVTPDIRDAERLQGFEADWTLPAVQSGGFTHRARWKLVGNAVCVPMATWVGRRLASGAGSDWAPGARLEAGASWPRAAWGDSDGAFEAVLGEFPIDREAPSLEDFLEYPTHPLSDARFEVSENDLRQAHCGTQSHSCRPSIVRSTPTSALASNRPGAGRCHLGPQIAELRKSRASLRDSAPVGGARPVLSTARSEACASPAVGTLRIPRFSDDISASGWYFCLRPRH